MTLTTDSIFFYEAGPELSSYRFEESFRFHREYVPSNGPPPRGHRHYKFSYDIGSVPDEKIRAAIRGKIGVDDIGCG